MDTAIACINGRFVPSHEAAIPISDRSFRFGDGVFETISLHRSVPYRWESHIARLQEGLIALQIAYDFIPELASAARTLIRENKASEGTLRIAVSRGSGSAGYAPAPAITPHWVMEYLPPRPLPSHPYTLYTSTYRRISPACLPTHVKLAQGLNSTLALMDAQAHGADDALQLSTNGLLSCAASGNLLWVKGKTLFTPALTTGCIAGTTRSRLMEAAPFPIHESSEPLDALENADALCISNSRLGVWPVRLLQPEELAFDPTHPILEALANFIQNDRDGYVDKNRLNWQ